MGYSEAVRQLWRRQAGWHAQQAEATSCECSRSAPSDDVLPTAAGQHKRRPEGAAHLVRRVHRAGQAQHVAVQRAHAVLQE